MEETKMAWPL